MNLFKIIGDCFEERLLIPLHLAVQMTPDALEHEWMIANDQPITLTDGPRLSIRNWIVFNVRPRYFAAAVLELMSKNVRRLKSELDVRTWEPLHNGLETAKAVLAGDADSAALKMFASDLRELNREPWNSSWIVFALGDAVEAISWGYGTDHGVTMLMRALRVGIQGRAIGGRPFEEEIARLFEKFLTKIGPPTAAEIVAAAIRHSEEPP